MAMDEERSIESALAAISARLDSLSESERKVAEFVVREPKKTLHFNVLHTNCLNLPRPLLLFIARSLL